MRLRHLADLGEDCLSLLRDDVDFIKIVDLAQHGALHDRPAFVVLDVPCPHRAIKCDLFRKALLLEEYYCKIVGVGEEVHHIGVCAFDVLFEVVHEHATVALS